MSRDTDRPMSEYESATHFALVALAEEFAKTSDSTSLLAKLRDQQDVYAYSSRTNAAGLLKSLIETVEQHSQQDLANG
jgi:hypothetical protein